MVRAEEKNMKNIYKKSEFLKSSVQALEGILDSFEKLPEIELNSLPAEETALIMVDMINGFTREGALKSSRVEGLIPEISRLSRRCESLQIKKLAFADCHTEGSPEFEAYPTHCLKGTYERKIVDEIKKAG